jgi:hypothetical protein
MEAFADKFGVSLAGFASDSYFGEESAFNPIYWIWCRVFFPESLHLQPISVSDLIDAARTRQWNKSL